MYLVTWLTSADQLCQEEFLTLRYAEVFKNALEQNLSNRDVKIKEIKK